MSTLPVNEHSAWDARAIAEFLEKAVIPMRLAVNDKSGFPRICSMWFGFDGEHILAVSHKKALMTRLLQNDGRCAFEIASNTEPYQGVRGQAMVRIDQPLGKTVLPELIKKYIHNRHDDLREFLLGRIDDEYALCLKLEWISAWDYSDRMLG